jgi:hypothetical protein
LRKLEKSDIFGQNSTLLGKVEFLFVLFFFPQQLLSCEDVLEINLLKKISNVDVQSVSVLSTASFELLLRS